MSVSQNSGKSKCGALWESCISSSRQSADRQILQVPFPTSESARQAAQQTVRIGGGEQFNRCADALTSRFVKPCFEQGQHGHADGTHEASHGREGLATTWLDRKSTRLNSSHLVISYAVF